MACPSRSTIAISPDGTTAYVAPVTVRPIRIAASTRREAHRRRGRHQGRDHPDGRTAYVLDEGLDSVTPVKTAPSTAGPAIKAGAAPLAIAITPDGTTVYVVSGSSDSVTPTSAAGKPIKVGSGPDAIAIAA